MITSNLPALQVVLPLLGAVLAALVRRGPIAWLIALVVSWAAGRRRSASNTASIWSAPIF
jgi:hypothetical protein